MQFGLANKRTYARMEVPRGFDPTQPNTFTHTAPVKTGVTILSGQAIVLEADDAHPTDPGRLSWALADADNSAHLLSAIFLALQDSNDEDVREADGLTGYDTAGQFEVETAFYTGTPFTAGTTLLALSTTAGSIAPTTLGSGLPILGRVSRPSPKAIGAINSNVPANAQVICWRTGYAQNPS